MPKVTEEHLAARRAQIVAAARTCFTERGFAGTSVPDVVRAAGLSTGAVYRYFPSKDDLVRAVCEDVHDELPTTFDEESLARFFAALRELAGRGHAVLLAQIHAAAAVTPELADLVREQRAGLATTLTRALEAERSPTAAAERAQGFLAVCSGYQTVLATSDADPAPYVAAASRVLRGR
jgi:AcrR family transcriptional regulator